MPLNDQIAGLVNNTSQLLDTVNVSRQQINNAASTANNAVLAHTAQINPHSQYVEKVTGLQSVYLDSFNKLKKSNNEEIKSLLETDDAKNYVSRVSIFKYFTEEQRNAWTSGNTTNDVTAALQLAHNSEFHLYYPPGRGRVTGVNGIVLRAGQIVSGAAGVPYNQNSFSSILINNTVDGSCFSYTGGTGGQDLPGPHITGMRLEADNPILLNEVNGLIQNNDGIPALIRPVITHNFIWRRSIGVGRAISLTRCFGAQVEFNTINGFSTGILLHGSDICNVSHNRIQGSSLYSIHEQTALTFGSQNNINHNDIIAYNSPNLVHIKSCSRHVRVNNNYIETTVACKGFIDIGTVDCPTFGTNTLTKCYSVEVSSNRIDGHHLASDYVYRLEPWAIQTKIHDSSTVGAAMSDWTKYLVIVGSYLPLVYDSGVRACIYDFSLDTRAGPLSTFNTLQDFDPFTTGLTPRSYSRACGNDLSMNNAFRHVLTDGESFVILPTLITANVSDGAYMRFRAIGGVNNPWFPEGGIYEMNVRARTSEANGDQLYLGMYDGAIVFGSLTTAMLTQFFRDYQGTVRGGSTNQVGLRIPSGITGTGNRFIKSITFSRRHHIRQNVSVNTVGDSAVSITNTSSTIIRFNSPLTAVRSVTFNTANMQQGYRYRIERTSSSTGNFSLDIGGLTVLQVGQWAEVEFTGTSMVLRAFGVDTANIRPDADAALTGTSSGFQSYRTVLASNRIITFDGSTNAFTTNQWFIIERLPSSTGGTLTIKTTNSASSDLTTLNSGETACVRWNGTGMELVWKYR